MCFENGSLPAVKPKFFCEKFTPTQLSVVSFRLDLGDNILAGNTAASAAKTVPDEKFHL